MAAWEIQGNFKDGSKRVVAIIFETTEERMLKRLKQLQPDEVVGTLEAVLIVNGDRINEIHAKKEQYPLVEDQK